MRGPVGIQPDPVGPRFCAAFGHCQFSTGMSLTRHQPFQPIPLKVENDWLPSVPHPLMVELLQKESPEGLRMPFSACAGVRDGRLGRCNPGAPGPPFLPGGEDAVIAFAGARERPAAGVVLGGGQGNAPDEYFGHTPTDEPEEKLLERICSNSKLKK